MRPLLTLTEAGLYCPDGDFHVDPWQPVPRAVLTHAHADHARPGSARYLCAEPSLPILRHRLGPDVELQGLAYGAELAQGTVSLSLHPAGHVLGSAQVRVERAGEVWVVSGDYKRAPDPSCAAFEPQRCHVFVSEATFALPIYRWPEGRRVVAEILEWWLQNRAAGRASVLFAYSLGKAQRILAELAGLAPEPVYAHGAVAVLCEAYALAGVALPPVQRVADAGGRRGGYEGALVLAPPSAAGSPWMRRFGDAATGMASGWMRVRGTRRRRGFERGFVLSDHADWPALLQTVADTGAARVLVTHGYSDVLARRLGELGLQAEVLRTAYGDQEDN